MKDDHRLPDTPWHVDIVKKDEADPRRHKSRCIHYQSGRCGWRGNYSGRCIGSSHCMDYNESYEEFEKKYNNRADAEQIEKAVIDKYKRGLEEKKNKLERSNNPYKYMKTYCLRRCLVCDEFLKSEKYSLKKCTYCGMFYVDINDFDKDEVMDVVRASSVFVMNIKKH